MNERPQPSAEAFLSVANSEHARADIDAARAELGEYRPVTTSADVERRSEEAAVSVAPMTAMSVAKPAVHAVSAAMATVTTTSGRSRGDSGRG